MNKIRVLVTYHDCLMRELLITLLRDQPDFEVLDGGTKDSEIEREVVDARADVVIMKLDHTNARPTICDNLLGRQRSIKILALAPERNTAILFWPTLVVRSASVENFPAGLLSILRSNAISPGSKPVQRVEMSPSDNLRIRLSR